ncbi:MAG TPA: PilT/PilU family type 4a pilus ATPase [bacterium]|nr:PilT/PilU family type 4a pilus ATPase [bacterium]
MPADAKLKEILALAAKISASDIHLKTFSAPVFRINGQLVKVEEFGPIKPEQMDVIVEEALNEEQRGKFKEQNELDLAYSLAGVGRFRMNVFRQRGSIGMVFRIIPFSVKPLDELLLPNILKKVALQKRGLILVTGTTGSGKSTTLAAMIEHINANRTCHIVTIEDPIEFLLRDKKSIINQREVGLDTMNFSRALRSALRQDPDVIMVGEMRDLETIEIALTAAETGHLVLSTLHTLDAAETINRIVGAFPTNQQPQVRQQLGAVLTAAVSQRLLKNKDGRGRVPAVEVLLNTQMVRELIYDMTRLKELHGVIERSHTNYGMQTFDQSIYQMFRDGHITQKEALDNATSPDDLVLRMKGVAISGDGDWSAFDDKGNQFGQKVEKNPAAAGKPVSDDEFELS